MRSHNWNRAALLALAALCCGPAFAQANVGGQPADLPTDTPPLSGIDTLSDALACRIDETRFPQLMRTLRGERAREFSQTYRQYSAPDLDLYQLDAPAQAWGNQSTAVVIAENRVMLAVTGSLDEVTQRLEQALHPLPPAVDSKQCLGGRCLQRLRHIAHLRVVAQAGAQQAFQHSGGLTAHRLRGQLRAA